MSPELEKAFCGVYSSSREIVRNKQHHLFCNMLDLLKSTCKATNGTLVSSIPKDDQINFWCNDILPLMFDEEIAVQSSAIDALEQGLLRLETDVIHSCSHWTSIRNAIINVHRPRVHNLREKKNENWHHVWCVLVRLLDREILKSASTINAFLSIVELGFRSPENQIRIEAFVCWRLLIKIFTAHGEIFSSKRLRLISIPLKSSQAKTEEAAVVKFRVWWYLLTCLGTRMEEFFEIIIENFVTFCFGARMRNIQGAAQQYDAVRELVLPCWATLLTANGESLTNDLLERTMCEHNLESFAQPSPLRNFTNLGKYRQFLVDAALESMRLLTYKDGDHTEAEQYMIELLMSYLMKPMLCLEDPSFSTQICRELIKFLPTHTRPVIFAINCIATEGLEWSNSHKNADDYADVMESLMHLLTAGKSAAVPPAILKRCIEQMFSLKALGTGRNQWRGLAIVLDLITENMLVTGNSDLYELRMLVWQHVSVALLEYLKDNGLDCRVKEYSEILNQWVIWPLSYYAAYARATISNKFDASFCTLWRRLLNAGQNSPKRGEFLSIVQQKLMDLLPLSSADVYFSELLDSYTAEVLKLENVKNLMHYRQLLTLLKSVIAASASSAMLESYLIVLRLVFSSLKDDEITTLQDVLKVLIKEVLTGVQKQSLNKKFFNDWKQAITIRLRAHSNKSMSSQMIDVFKSNDTFVPIPSVWSLNPDKLTDHQKERFREKTDIPALYNDMSVSQESSSIIKPWTPKKIILPRDDHTQVVIEKQEQEQDETKKTEPIATPRTAESNKSRVERKRSLRSQRKLLPTIEINNTEMNFSIDPHILTKENQSTHECVQDRRDELKNQNLPVEIDLTDTPPESVCMPTEATTKAKTDEQNDKAKSDNNKTEENHNDKPEEGHNDKTKENHDDKTKGDHNDKTEAEHHAKTKEEHNQENITHKLETVELIKKTNTTYVGELDKTGEVHHSQNHLEVLKEQSTVDKEQNVLNTFIDHIDNRIMSPKRNFIKYTSLSSPPDRKLTNNSTSPTLRPKPSALLTGRGAQLINMIRNKKVDLTLQSSGSVNASTTKTCHTPIFAKGEKIMDVCMSGTETLNDPPMEPEHTSTPRMSKDFLVFSRTLPSLQDSPSRSILKRKLRRESLEDISVESPMQKRKRVSFHDPPVSLTKEYLRDADESKSKLKRCLNMDKVSLETKHLLKRQNKLHSMAQIENYLAEKSEKKDAVPNTIFNTETENPQKLECLETIKDAPAQMPIDLTQVDADTLLNFIVQNHSFDVVLDKYFSMENASAPKSPSVLAKYISNYMTANPKMKTTVLEILSENHSKDFLDHAIQENLSSVVCDRLNLNSVMDYICAKSQINANCRTNLLTQLPEIFKQCKGQNERLDYIKQLLHCTDLKDNDILEIITLLMQKRSNGEFHEVVSVSESAADSSSNL